MNIEHNKRCQEGLADLKRLRTLGSLSEDQYAKGVVSISYEYALVNELDIAVGLLMRLPLAYFEHVQAQQMIEDPIYGQVCVVLAERLVAAGVSTHGVPARA